MLISGAKLQKIFEVHKFVDHNFVNFFDFLHNFAFFMAKSNGRGFVGCHPTTMDNGKRKDEKGKMKEEKIMAAEMSPLFLMYNLVSFFLLNLHKLINTLIFFRIICTKLRLEGVFIRIFVLICTKLRFEGVFIRIFVLICTKIGIDSAKRTNKDFAGMKKKQ